MDSNMMTRKVFSEAEELFLVVDINKVAKMNYGLAKKGVRSLVYKFAMANIKNRPVKWDEDETAGEEWLRLFMTRHTAMLIIKKPEKTNLLRAIAFNPTNVETFLKNLEDVQGGQISEVGGCISETNDRRELRNEMCHSNLLSFLSVTGPFQIHHPQRRPRIEKERSHRSGGRGGSRHAPVLYARGGHRDPDGGQRLQDHRRELCLGRDAKRHRESPPTFQPIPRRHVSANSGRHNKHRPNLALNTSEDSISLAQSPALVYTQTRPPHLRESVRSVAVKYSIGKSTVSDICKNKANIMDYVAEDHNLDKRKTLRLSAYPAMEKALYTWFVQERARDDEDEEENIPLATLTKKIIKSKELQNELNEEINYCSRTICTSQNAYNDDNLDNRQNGTQPHAEQEIEAEDNATLHCGRERDRCCLFPTE
ncbi:homeobox-like domain superfamily [Holotrichia oblita]|uniref:Homeobox-like domain superfamily n=1 Tax=Holotrichia oblita TaxID=644536 RepID=A0ACB9TYW6_HOLOL|nr:homeobox-like domain superfamily [Holotrichia oblita]